MKGILPLMLLSAPLCAEPAVTFKPETHSNSLSMLYLFVLLACLGVIFFLALRQKTRTKTSKHTKIIERFDLNPKTKAYVIDFKGQQFLIAEHPQALAIHPIAKNEATEHV